MPRSRPTPFAGRNARDFPATSTGFSDCSLRRYGRFRPPSPATKQKVIALDTYPLSARVAAHGHYRKRALCVILVL
ncbi:unnamed protein product [Prunus armeniaca]